VAPVISLKNAHGGLPRNVADKRDWRSNCATGGRGNARRQIVNSTPLSDEEQWLDGRTLAIEGEIERLRVPTVELETAVQ
jgi:hypothetical protein